MFQREPFPLHFRTGRTFRGAHPELGQRRLSPSGVFVLFTGPPAVAGGPLPFRQNPCPVLRSPAALALAADLEMSSNGFLHLPREHHGNF